MNHLNAVAYCRYSTDNQTENSIAYQLNAIEKYCQEHNMQLIDVYSDEAKSGINTNREGLQRLIQDIKSRKFQAVVLYDQTRLSRSVVDWFTLRETLQNNGIQIHAVHSQIGGDINNPTVFLNESVSAIFGQMHVLQTREKTLDGVASKARQAEFCGGIPPLGYDIQDGKYQINVLEAEGIRLIFFLYADGYSYNEIVDILDEKKIRSKRGRKIGNNALYWILRNERYIGNFVYNQKQYKVLGKRQYIKENPADKVIRIPGAIPPIIDLDTWNRVQQRLSDHKRNGANTAKRDYLLSGLIECGECHSSYCGFTSLNKGGRPTSYYSCGRKRRLRDCHSRNVKADLLERAVLNIIRNNILSDQFIQTCLAALADSFRQQDLAAPKLKAELDVLQRSIDNLIYAIEKGVAADHIYQRINDLTVKKETLTRKMNQRIIQPYEIDMAAMYQKIRSDSAALFLSPRKSKAIIRQYLHKIEITGNNIEMSFSGNLLLCCAQNLSTTGGATQI